MTALLVFSKTTEYRHESIPAGIAAVNDIGIELGLTVEATEDAAAFDTANLARYRAVVFLSTSGVVFDDEQRPLSSRTSAPAAPMSEFTRRPPRRRTGPSTATWSAPASRRTRRSSGRPSSWRTARIRRPLTWAVAGRSSMSGTTLGTIHGRGSTSCSQSTSRPTRAAPWARAIRSPGTTTSARPGASTRLSGTPSRRTRTQRSAPIWRAASVRCSPLLPARSTDHRHFGVPSPSVPMISRRWVRRQAMRRDFTAAATVPPSARPATCGWRIFITAPMSRGDVAPVSAIAASTMALSSSSVSGAGR